MSKKNKMIIKRYILLILSILAFVINAMAQDCYSDNRAKGVSAYNSGKYAEAKKYFQSAQNCDMKPKQNDLSTWIGKCNEKMRQTQSTTIQGELQGVFSVSSTKKVRFSKGNLQYQASTNTWKFAEQQWDIIGSQNSFRHSWDYGTITGSDNANISVSYNGWIDLFGWGTSGFNGKYPYMTSEQDEDYGKGQNPISGTNYDWGIYNKISNGGNTKGIWRTLTYSEWDYMLNKRKNALNKRGLACVNKINGIVLLPDAWEQPNDLTFMNDNHNYSDNTYTIADWLKMESNGAVFLPAAGTRLGRSVSYVNNTCEYWSSSVLGTIYAYRLKVYETQIFILGNHRYDGRAVRLVKDVK